MLGFHTKLNPLGWENSNTWANFVLGVMASICMLSHFIVRSFVPIWDNFTLSAPWIPEWWISQQAHRVNYKNIFYYYLTKFRSLPTQISQWRELKLAQVGTYEGDFLKARQISLNADTLLRNLFKWYLFHLTERGKFCYKKASVG